VDHSVIPRSISLATLQLLAGAFLGHTNVHADWPQFMGPNRNGVSADSVALADALPEDGLAKGWSHKLGAGFAGPIVTGERCLIFHREGTTARLESLHAKTGKAEWSFDYQTGYVDQFGFDPGPRSTPTVVDDRVFIHGVEGTLHAVDLKTGKALWKHDLAKDFNSPPGFFGRSSSPLVVGDKVMVDIGGRYRGKPATLVAFDVKTGKVTWTAGEGEADYGAPMLLQVPSDSPTALFFVRNGFLGVDPANGMVRFQEPFRSRINASVNAASPVVVGERFFLSSCYDVGAGVWEWDEGKLRSVYKKQGVLDCHFNTPVYFEGHLYGFHGRQETGQELRCLELNTGEVKWKAPLPAGSVTIADGKLLVLTERGELLVGKASPSAWQIHYRAQVGGAETRALPAIAGKYFYVRDKRQLSCVQLP